MSCPICQPGLPCAAHQPVNAVDPRDTLQLDWTVPEHSTKHVASDTSQAAAKQIDAKTIRGRVLRFLARGSATDETMQRELRINPSTQRPRRVELVERGLVRDSGRRQQTSSGRKAIVWETT